MKRRNLLAALLFAPFTSLAAKLLPTGLPGQPLRRLDLKQSFGFVKDKYQVVKSPRLLNEVRQDVNYTTTESRGNSVLATVDYETPHGSYTHTFEFSSDKATTIGTCFHVDHVVVRDSNSGVFTFTPEDETKGVLIIGDRAYVGRYDDHSKINSVFALSEAGEHQLSAAVDETGIVSPDDFPGITNDWQVYSLPKLATRTYSYTAEARLDAKGHVEWRNFMATPKGVWGRPAVGDSTAIIATKKSNA